MAKRLFPTKVPISGKDFFDEEEEWLKLTPAERGSGDTLIWELKDAFTSKSV